MDFCLMIDQSSRKMFMFTSHTSVWYRMANQLIFSAVPGSTWARLSVDSG